MAVLKAELVAPKIREMHGNLAAVARTFGVTRQGLHAFVQRHPTLVEVCQECRESMKDNAESSLYKAVLAGEAWAVCFYLKTQGKDRGYVEKGIIQHEGATPVTFVEVPVDASGAGDHTRNGTGHSS